MQLSKHLNITKLRLVKAVSVKCSALI